jgi:hypothetical protein
MTNQREKALEALRASLRLNPQQEEIRKLVQEIEKEKKFIQKFEHLDPF